ncbi:MAG: prephenate dehydrogenase/arogenate dehydrogenase family protein [bacterium]|nr:prephenate dehydrogenase/arogenate dehydrogenase family protein [bacterium]
MTVIGVGLLGGSAALAIKAHDPSVRVAGVGRRKVSLDAAMEVGAIDTAHLDPAECVGKSDLVILATPVGAFEKHLRSVAPVLGADTLVTDVGSTKVGVARLARQILGPSGRFVGSHPMAGSEQKGVRFSRADLFSGATCIITPTASTPDDVADAIEAFWKSLGMRVVRRSPAAHDRAVARISHLPHMLAALMMLLPGKNDLDVSASGFRDVTRLASGDPEMWRDILQTNRGAVLAALDRFSKDASDLRDLIDQGDVASIEKFLARAKRRRDTTIARVIVDRRLSAE